MKPYTITGCHKSDYKITAPDGRVVYTTEYPGTAEKITKELNTLVDLINAETDKVNRLQSKGVDDSRPSNS